LGHRCYFALDPKHRFWEPGGQLGSQTRVFDDHLDDPSTVADEHETHLGKSALMVQPACYLNALANGIGKAV
jgi:hypothetical protein